MAASPLLLVMVLMMWFAMVMAVSSPRPHIVLIVADDYGWNNVGYHGNTEVLTPNLDALATEYLELDRMYAFKVCGPSRASIFTGRLPPHVTLLNDNMTVYNPEDPISGYAGVTLGMTLFAEKLQEVGYNTVFTGKWNAGTATNLHLPLNRGYNQFLGYNDYVVDYYTQRPISPQTSLDIVHQTTFYPGKPPVPVSTMFFAYINGDLTTVQSGASLEICKNNFLDLWLNDGPAFLYANTGYLEDSFTQFTLTRLWEHDPSTPLFLHHAFHLCHAPLEVPIAWQQPFVNVTFATRRKYDGMAFYMDHVVGLIVNVLQTKNMFDNTLIIFTSDNGGPLYFGGGANNYPLRGGKASNWEGGHRVNSFIAGGLVPQKMRGKKITGFSHTADIYATVLDFAGISPNNVIDEKAAFYDLPPLDSLSMKSYWLGETSESPRTEIYLDVTALIVGDYKIITGVQSSTLWQAPIYPTETTLSPNPILGLNTNATYNESYGLFDCGTGCVFNIIEDPNETTDLSETMPQIKQQLLARLAVLNETAFIPNRGKDSALACLAAATVWGGFKGPFAPSPNMTFTR